MRDIAPSMGVLRVQAHWDDAARVWWADSNDIPGFVTEADTFPDLVQHVRSLAPLAIRENLGREPHGAVVHIAGRSPNQPTRVCRVRLSG
jgi:hypothetical protein